MHHSLFRAWTILTGVIAIGTIIFFVIPLWEKESQENIHLLNQSLFSPPAYIKHVLSSGSQLPQQ